MDGLLEAWWRGRKLYPVGNQICRNRYIVRAGCWQSPPALFSRRSPIREAYLVNILQTVLKQETNDERGGQPFWPSCGRCLSSPTHTRFWFQGS